jgi:hypothetical protein
MYYSLIHQEPSEDKCDSIRRDKPVKLQIHKPPERQQKRGDVPSMNFREPFLYLTIESFNGSKIALKA